MRHGIFNLMEWKICQLGSERNERNQYEEPTSISRKFSGGPYISSKLCWRASGIACILAVEYRKYACFMLDGNILENTLQRSLTFEFLYDKAMIFQL